MRPLLLFAALLLFIACNAPATKKPPATANTGKTKRYTPILRNIYDSIYPEPNPVFLRKRLFGFFERHKNEDVFDTVDNTYQAYWGPACYSAYFVDAGHLFNKDQVHCMIIFSDDATTKMFIYLKKQGNWKKIFEDTSIDDVRANPVLRDWNCDGTKDIGMPFENTWSENVNLWLMDRSGEKLHYVKDFIDLPNPVLDSVAGTISSAFVHAGGGRYGAYRFSNYHLKETEGLGIWFDGENTSKCVLEYYRNDKTVKKIKVPSKDVQKYVPKQWQENIEEYFGM